MYILFILLLNGPWSSPNGITSAEFSSEQSCVAAANDLKQVYGGWGNYMTFRCEPK